MARLTLRPRLVRRKRERRADRLLHEQRCPPARLYRIQPDPAAPYRIEVHICRDRRHMRSLANLERDPVEPQCMGLVRHYVTKTTGRRARLANGVIARMYLNRRDLQDRPSEIIAHECTHAGMGWARFRGETLRTMRSEEVLCYATGRMVANINRICYAEKVFR